MLEKIKSFTKSAKSHYIIIILICLLEVLIITEFKYVFGSNTDWLKQHIIFPDYFRCLFYKTGDLFLDFAFNIGAGQNIYYFAYYGLYNPIILISYLFPFISMDIYIIISSILIVIISVLLFYYFLKKNNFSNNICFIVSLLFLFSSSFLFHSHRHIMFINYMPFLILGMIGVDNYFNKNSSMLLIVSIFLMILTSYYYSISGIIVLCLYGLLCCLKECKYSLSKEKIFRIMNFVLRILLGILLASFLLLPVIYVVLNGRSSSGVNLNIEYFIPSIKLEYLMYGSYGVGLTSILWISLIYNILFLNKECKIISVIILIIVSLPIINLLLNGGLYLNGKVFIPFIPLFLLLIALMIKDISLHRINWYKLVFAVIISVLLFIDGVDKVFVFIDIIFTMLLLYLLNKRKKYIYFVPIIFISFIISVYVNKSDNLISIDDYYKQKKYFKDDVLNYINVNTNFLYRYQDDLNNSNGINHSFGGLDYKTTLYSSTSNINYINSFYNSFNNNDIYRNNLMLSQTNNLFFQKFMGIRYLLTDKKPPFGYKKIIDYNDSILYENEYTYPIGFSSTHLLNKNEYYNLSYIEKIEAYQNNIIIDGLTSNPNLNFKINKYLINVKNVSKDKLIVMKENNNYLIDSKNKGKIIIHLMDKIDNETLVIRFKMNYIPSCRNGDVSISVNGIKNKLTCKEWKYYNNNETFDYVISSNDIIDKLEVEFSKGLYNISDIEMYKIDNSFFKEYDITPLEVDYSKITTNKIEGKINQLENGYFIFSIPYDRGFSIFLDGKRIEYEKVNECFIGFYIPKGYHNIKLEFKAPLADSGKVVTLISGCLVVLIMVYEKKVYKN